MTPDLVEPQVKYGTIRPQIPRFHLPLARRGSVPKKLAIYPSVWPWNHGDEVWNNGIWSFPSIFGSRKTNSDSFVLGPGDLGVFTVLQAVRRQGHFWEQKFSPGGTYKILTQLTEHASHQIRGLIKSYRGFDTVYYLPSTPMGLLKPPLHVPCRRWRSLRWFSPFCRFPWRYFVGCTSLGDLAVAVESLDLSSSMLFIK